MSSTTNVNQKLAVLETDVKHHDEDIKEIRDDMKALIKEIKNDFRRLDNKMTGIMAMGVVLLADIGVAYFF